MWSGELRFVDEGWDGGYWICRSLRAFVLSGVIHHSDSYFCSLVSLSYPFQMVYHIPRCRVLSRFPTACDAPLLFILLCLIVSVITPLYDSPYSLIPSCFTRSVTPSQYPSPRACRLYNSNTLLVVHFKILPSTTSLAKLL